MSWKVAKKSGRSTVQFPGTRNMNNKIKTIKIHFKRETDKYGQRSSVKLSMLLEKREIFSPCVSMIFLDKIVFCFFVCLFVCYMWLPCPLKTYKNLEKNRKKGLTSTDGHTNVGWYTKIYIHFLGANTGCRPEDIPKVMAYVDGWRKRVKGTRVVSTL